MSVIDEKTKIPLVLGITAIIVIVVPLTLYFASTKADAATANTDNTRQDKAIEALSNNQATMMADIREIKTILSERDKRK